MLEYELVDANRGIQKVRVEPATRSAVATCNQNETSVILGSTLLVEVISATLSRYMTLTTPTN